MKQWKFFQLVVHVFICIDIFYMCVKLYLYTHMSSTQYLINQTIKKHLLRNIVLSKCVVYISKHYLSFKEFILLFLSTLYVYHLGIHYTESNKWTLLRCDDPRVGQFSCRDCGKSNNSSCGLCTTGRPNCSFQSAQGNQESVFR